MSVERWATLRRSSRWWASVALAGTALAIAVLAGSGRAGDPGPAGGWTALTPSPLQRTEVGAARIGDRIYVVGGFIAGGGSTGRLVVYDISEDRWRERAELPIAVNHPGVAALRGRLYLLGGDLPPGAPAPKSDRLYRYAPDSDRWQRLPDAPTARSALGLVGVGRRLYAVGGASATEERLGTVEIFDTRSRRWSAGAPMPTGRNHVGATRLERAVIVTGGRPGPVSGNLATAELYDPKRDRWSALPDLATARSGHAAVAVGGRHRGRVVVVGGEELAPGGETIAEVEVFDPRHGAWSGAPPMPTPRHGLGAAARGSRVFALEGGPEPGLSYSGALELLDLR